jgi:hypothetical protein
MALAVAALSGAVVVAVVNSGAGGFAYSSGLAAAAGLIAVVLGRPTGVEPEAPTQPPEPRLPDYSPQKDS